MALFRRKREPEEARDLNPYSLDTFIADYFSYAGAVYPTFSLNQSDGGLEEGGSGFEGLVQSAYRSNGIVFACMMARAMVFSDVRFTFREIRNNVPGDIATTIDARNPAYRGLQLLRTPWVGGTTGDLLARMIQDVDVSGNAFVARQGDQLVRLRPDWVTIVAETPEDASLWHPDARVAGFIYKPGGPATDDEPVSFLAEDVAHWAPTPDPTARFRGVSWLDSVLNEVGADKSMTRHRRAFFDNGATVNLMLEYPADMKRDLFDFAVKTFSEKHVGVENAYKVLHLLGATAKPVGADLQQVDFKNVQAAGETRIAIAAGVPAAILGNSEGLQGSSLNTGNFSAARRLFGDKTIRPLWRNVCGSLQVIIPPPPKMELWTDDSDVAFLREDQKDAAEIRQLDASTLSTLVTAGYDPSTALEAITSGDFRRLKHTGLVSVQLLPPGESAEPNEPPRPEIGENAKWAMRDALRGIVSEAVKGEVKQLTLDFIERTALPNPSQPAEVNVTMPEVRVEPQTINVNVPEREVNVAAPEVNVTTPDVNITVPPADPTPVHVNVESAPITVEVPEQRAPDVTVNVPEQAAPTVNVTAPDVTVNVPEAPVPSVEVHVPEQPAPKVEVNLPRAKRTRKTIERDEKTGLIESVVEEDME